MHSVRSTSISETNWQQQVVELAGLLRWRHLHVRRSIGKGQRWTTATNVKGFPDLLLWHEIQQRVIGAELKTAKGRVTPEQTEILRSLAAAGIETYVWRPADLPEVQAILTGPRRS
jgi:hypothetical protein